MEIRNEYPKVNIKHLISKNLLKVGLFSFGIAMMFSNNVLAMSVMDIPPSGSYSDIGPTLRPFDVVWTIVQIVSLIIFVVTGLSILITKIKAKKQPEPKKVKKWIKILFIISIIVFILSILTEPIIYDLEVIIKNNKTGLN